MGVSFFDSSAAGGLRADAGRALALLRSDGVPVGTFHRASRCGRLLAGDSVGAPAGPPKFSGFCSYGGVAGGDAGDLLVEGDAGNRRIAGDPRAGYSGSVAYQN